MKIQSFDWKFHADVYAYFSNNFEQYQQSYGQFK